MSNKLITQGTLKLVGERKSFNSGSYKTEFVLTVPGQYPKDVAFEAWKEKADLISTMRVGDTLEVAFDLDGREWNGRYFVSLKAYDIKRTGATAAQPVTQAQHVTRNTVQAADAVQAQALQQNLQAAQAAQPYGDPMYVATPDSDLPF